MENEAKQEVHEAHGGPHIPEKDYRIAFYVTLALKALFALAETALGLMFLVTGSVSGFILSLVNEELIEDPHDFVATHIAQAAAHFTPGAQFYVALYLIAHGVVKGFLIWALMRNKLWAYPWSLAVFGAFIVYQAFKWYGSHSIWLVLLTVVDLIVMGLIYHEWRYMRGKRRIVEA